MKVKRNPAPERDRWTFYEASKVNSLPMIRLSILPTKSGKTLKFRVVIYFRNVIYFSLSCIRLNNEEKN
jgi:hypothetical protein